MRSIFSCSNERGDQALSIGGKHNPVQCLERWQIAVKIENFLKIINFWKSCESENVNWADLYEMYSIVKYSVYKGNIDTNLANGDISIYTRSNIIAYKN